MNNTWWQELLKFFLHKLDINRVVHMLIIFIALVILVPPSLKEMVNARNPEIFGNYWMYYLLLGCLSFFLSAITRNIERKFLAQLSSSLRSLRIRLLSVDEKTCLIELLKQPGCTAQSSYHNPVVEGLVEKGYIFKVSHIDSHNPYSTYWISDEHYARIVKLLHRHL